ncbi:maleylpyruvate isomerase family mycothiol-dependent enzyme [Streptomyces nanhaiensis]|uniref:maleylpyruvate isomerase family mycothiol-dependent enzyme n=1 Tax=Streptomyces nanhaiensis TaxID=679319 RepID=UPI00399CD041
MAPLSLLTRTQHGLQAFRACLDGDLDAPVEHCGGWTLRDPAGHLGAGNRWAAAAVTEGHGDHRPRTPRDPAEPAGRFEGTCSVLLEALRSDPSAPAWTFHPPHTVGFRRRRRCLETLVHRWDAENALGTARPLGTETAAESVAEVFDTMAPRQSARGRAVAPGQAVRLVSTGTGAPWVHGPGTPVATASATAADLPLMLWGRVPADDGRIAWEGDRAAGLRVLDGPLVP